MLERSSASREEVVIVDESRAYSMCWAICAPQAEMCLLRSV